MDAQSVRRAADRSRLQTLSTASEGRISSLDDQVVNRYVIDLRYFTAGSRNYPQTRQPATRVVIELGARYPFQPPAAHIVTPIFHPNVFTSGLVCLGTKWLPSEGIDLFVQRIARLITFDPLLTNPHSAANGEAAGWYQRALRMHPEAFPSDRVTLRLDETSKPAVQWGTGAASVQPGSEAAPNRIVVRCPQCGGGLRLPRGKEGTVECPRCRHRFAASTQGG